MNEEAAFTYVEARLWPNGPHCPFCGATEEHVGKLKGKTTRMGLYKCYACKKPFTVRNGTIFESSHLPLHLWLQVIHLMCASKKGISTRQIQRMLQCSMKTAWFLTHRIRLAMADNELGPLGGEGMAVETDETFIGGKEKNRHKSKRAKTRLGASWGKETVLSLVERKGRVRSMHVASVTAANLRPVFWIANWSFSLQPLPEQADESIEIEVAQRYMSVLLRPALVGDPGRDPVIDQSQIPLAFE